MAKLIRKISVGKDYKNDAMHYAVGQEVYGGHTICDIVEEDGLFQTIFYISNEIILQISDIAPHALVWKIKPSSIAVGGNHF